MDAIEYEHEVKVFCPRCGGTDVVIEVINGFFHFSSCNRCGYKIQKILRQE